MTALAPTVQALLHHLRDEAMAHPIDVSDVLQMLASFSGKQQYQSLIDRQTIVIPDEREYLIAFMLESGHPGLGTCRHLMLFYPGPRKASLAEAWSFATELGFTGMVDDCEYFFMNENSMLSLHLVQRLAEREVPCLDSTAFGSGS